MPPDWFVPGLIGNIALIVLVCAALNVVIGRLLAVLGREPNTTSPQLD